MDKGNSEAKLILSTQTHDVALVWMEGYAHGLKDDKSITENPYPIKSQAYEDWQNGYEAGFYGEEALYPNYQIDIDDPKEESQTSDTNRKIIIAFSIIAILSSISFVMMD